MARQPANRLTAYDTLRLTACWILVLLTPSAVAAQASALHHYDFASGRQRALPAELREISGLATRNGITYAHNDERGAIWQFDRLGAITRAPTHLTRQVLLADFEGITAATTGLIMVTSNGVLYASGWQRDTGAGNLCEIEGLAHRAGSKELLLGCKQPRHRSLRGRTVVLGYSMTGARSPPVIRLQLQRDALRQHLGSPELRITSLEVHPDTHTVFILSSQPRAIVECDWQGNIIAAVKLSPRDHPQPEALTFGSDGTLWIGDEGEDEGRLTIYPLKSKVRS